MENLLRDFNNICYAHSINLCEVYYDAIRRLDKAQADEAITDIKIAGVTERNDFDEGFWKQVGQLKAAYRASLADFCAVVLAKQLTATVITSDHHEFDALHDAQICPIQFIR